MSLTDQVSKQVQDIINHAIFDTIYDNLLDEIQTLLHYEYIPTTTQQDFLYGYLYSCILTAVFDSVRYDYGEQFTHNNKAEISKGIAVHAPFIKQKVFEYLETRKALA